MVEEYKYCYGLKVYPDDTITVIFEHLDDLHKYCSSNGLVYGYTKYRYIPKGEKAL